MQLLAKTAKIISFLSALHVPDVMQISAVVDEGSATKILGSAAVSGAQMIVTLPGTKVDFDGVDIQQEENTLIIWVLTKGAGQTAGKIVDPEVYLHLLTLMTAVLETFRKSIRESQSGACPYLAGIDIQQIITTPEYNVFGGWNGWCSSIALK